MLPVHFISTQKTKMTGTMLQKESIILITDIDNYNCFDVYNLLKTNCTYHSKKHTNDFFFEILHLIPEN